VVIDEDTGAEGPVDDPPASVPDDKEADTLASAWEGSHWASLVPVAVELPVVLTIGGQYIRGTVDAVYEHPDGGLEIVDIKTGPLPDDDPGWLQLEAYALGVPEVVKLTFVSLKGGRASVASRDAGLLGAKELLTEALHKTRGPYGCPGCNSCGSPPSSS
jgi:RecB family exonuclease